MARIAGVSLPNKQLVYALPYIYGVGFSLAKKICKEINLEPTKKADELTQEEASRIEKYLEGRYEVEGDLRRKIQSNIKRLIEIGCYRGSRHKNKLPARGQRTKTNARTKKGKKKTAGSGKKKLTKK
ncbi:MAG: 30S ribosomal protein S13 [Patescibacteria group bacterium]